MNPITSTFSRESVPFAVVLRAIGALGIRRGVLALTLLAAALPAPAQEYTFVTLADTPWAPRALP